MQFQCPYKREEEGDLKQKRRRCGHGGGDGTGEVTSQEQQQPQKLEEWHSEGFCLEAIQGRAALPAPCSGASGFQIVRG